MHNDFLAKRQPVPKIGRCLEIIRLGDNLFLAFFTFRLMKVSCRSLRFGEAGLRLGVPQSDLRTGGSAAGSHRWLHAILILMCRCAGVAIVFVKFLSVIRVLELKSCVFGMRDQVRCRRILFLDSRVGRALLELNLGWIHLGSISEQYPNVLVPWPAFSRGLPNVAFDHLEIRQSLVQKGLCNILRRIPAGSGLVTPYFACHLGCNLKVFLAISHHCGAFWPSSSKVGTGTRCPSTWTCWKRSPFTASSPSPAWFQTH